MVGDNWIVERILGEVTNGFEVERVELLKRKRRIPEIAGDVGMYILKMLTGLDNRKIGEISGVTLSAATKATLRVSEQMSTHKELKKKVDRLMYSIFKV